MQCACGRCAVPLPFAGTCGACLRSAPAFDAAVAAFEYRFPVDRMVQRFKYRADLAMGRWLAHSLAAAVARGPRPDLLVPTPLTRRRLRERGFNQAAEIAKALGRELSLDVELRALSKLRDTPPQSGLHGRARRANLRSAFGCEVALGGIRVALVDDVITTGATARACAEALKRAGAARVDIWALARTP